jgi:GMP synthase (glutamine-hydrolysing)
VDRKEARVIRFRLLQAREPDEPTALEERDAFCARLGLPREAVVAHDLLHLPTTLAAVTEGVDAVLVGGSGRFGINDDAPWIPAFVDTLGGLSESGFPTFASCFGFQGLCVALGTSVVSDPEMSEVGTFDIQLTAAAADDPLFSALPPRFAGQEGHKDSATGLPNGATLLASSERCPVQAIRVGEQMYATQFHPELTVDDQLQRFNRYFDLYVEVFGRVRAQEIVDGMRPSPEANGLLRRFAELIGGV